MCSLSLCPSRSDYGSKLRGWFGFHLIQGDNSLLLCENPCPTGMYLPFGAVSVCLYFGQQRDSLVLRCRHGICRCTITIAERPSERGRARAPAREIRVVCSPPSVRPSVRPPAPHPKFCARKRVRVHRRRRRRRQQPGVLGLSRSLLSPSLSLSLTLGI